MKTKKMITAMVMLFIGMGIFLTACNETFEAVPERDALKMSETSCNNYESIGEFHNDALNYFMQFSSEFPAFEGDENGLREFVVNKTKEYYDSVNEEFPTDLEIDYDQMNGEAIVESIASNQFLSDYEKEILTPLYSSIPDLLDENEFTEFLTSVAETECLVASSDQIDNPQGILQILSVTKSSAQLWHDYGTGGTNGSSELNWGGIAFADAAGALAGFPIPHVVGAFAIISSSLTAAHQAGWIN